VSVSAVEAQIPSAQLAEEAARLALTRVTERLQDEKELSETHLASLSQSIARFRQLYASLEQQAHKDAEDDDDAPPMPQRLDSKTLQVIKEQVYGIHS
jgi:hypothetical protein